MTAIVVKMPFSTITPFCIGKQIFTNRLPICMSTPPMYSRSRYLPRLCVWTNPSVTKNTKIGAAIRPIRVMISGMSVRLQPK